MRRQSILPLCLLCLSVLTAAIFLGGGSRQGYVGDVVTQLLAIPLLLMGLWSLFMHGGWSRGLIAPLLLLGLTVAISVAQLVPLPQSVADFVQGPRPETGAAALAWAPARTWAALASLLAPVAVFIAVAQLPVTAQRQLAGAIVALACVSAAVGLLQVAQGPSSPLWLFENPNASEAVGFFANRNHFAALLYAALVLVATFVVAAVRRLLEAGGLASPRLLAVVGLVVVVAALIAGLVAARSRAGLLLAMAGLVVVVVLAVQALARDRRGEATGWMSPRRVALLGIAGAVLFAAQLGLGGILARFDQGLGADLRPLLWWRTLEAAWQAWPVGTGLGSFVPVFAYFEPDDEVMQTFANRAHNDFAEFLLETGAVGALVLVLALLWIGSCLWSLWPRPDPEPPKQRPEPDHLLLKRLAATACLLVLAHSFFDYPLRTTAMASVFAFCLAVFTVRQVAPALPVPDPGPAEPRSRRSRGEDRRRPSTNEPRPRQPEPPRSDWLSDVEWPDEWKGKS